jgi:hypothetical protein
MNKVQRYVLEKPGVCHVLIISVITVRLLGKKWYLGFTDFVINNAEHKIFCCCKWAT